MKLCRLTLRELSVSAWWPGSGSQTNLQWGLPAPWFPPDRSHALLSTSSLEAGWEIALLKISSSQWTLRFFILFL